MGIFNEDGDLDLYSEGENPKATYIIDWKNIKSVEDIKSLLQPAITFVNCDYSSMTEQEVMLINKLLNDKILK